ncbi:uncharacterized protein LOC124132878 [Haliotis rufescens]|uniref:uncharacterized protein LOC124132878 n=1 Tax=Haliotis rufescens TaxID=6454 RepID=UPI00201F1E16|nr:uncharacterized protein LOC124132878 [Haliotis rufescens]XP_048254379.1 uncharacterized protein LOC124132878 [Haliotis rufescens]
MEVPISFVQGDSIFSGVFHYFLIFTCLHLSFGVSHPDFSCPEVAELERPAVLQCSVSHSDTTIKYEGPNGVDAPQCDLGQGRCTGFGVYSASIVNNSNTVLQISSVEQSMEGVWKCTDDARRRSSACMLHVFKTPSCNITSGANTDVVAAGEEASLDVTIFSFFCSGASNFTLQIGNTSQTLDTAVDYSAKQTVSVSINVTDSHYGALRLLFSCHRYQRSLPCAGIAQLHKPASTGGGAISYSRNLILYISIINLQFPWSLLW